MPPRRRRRRRRQQQELQQQQQQQQQQDPLFDAVADAYVTPGHPVAYSAPKTVASNFGISKSRARKILEHLDGYTLHREYKQPPVYNPYYVHNRRELAQGDLIDISRLAANNDGVRFLLLLIDVFTKKVWVFPLKTKRASDVKPAIQSWLQQIPVAPKKLMTDMGLEFTNAPVQQVLRSAGVEWEGATGTLKAAVAERANKTIQILIYKHLTAHETTRYIDVLPDLIRTYNSRPHRTLEGMTPDNADDPGNEDLIQQIYHTKYARMGRHRAPFPKFSIGTIVRVKTDSGKLSQNRRAYAEQFKGEFFRVVRINRTLPVPMYYLRSLDSGDFIQGAFYSNELQRQRGDVWKIEQVLDQRVRRGISEIFVKWKFFGPQHNSWIPRRDVVQRF